MEFSRRTFLKLAMVGGAATAAEDGIRKAGRLVPYVVHPEKLPPALWHTVSTTCRECPAGCGMHVRHKDGRITKAEGNPGHPINRGGLCPRGQSALQGVYDPDRVREVLYRAPGGRLRPSGWKDALEQIGKRLAEGEGRVAIMSRLETGMLSEIMSRFLQAFGSDRLLFFEPFHYGPLREAHARLFGTESIPFYRLDKCDYLVSFGADFLETWISNVQFAADFGALHAFRNGKVGRFTYIGPRLSMTACNADDFIQTSPGGERDIALALLKILYDENRVRNGRNVVGPLVGNFDIRGIVNPGFPAERLRKMALLFADAPAGAALAGPVAASSREAAELALAVSLLNYAAGRYGALIDPGRSHALAKAATDDTLAKFVQGLSQQDVLIIHRANPVYTRPLLMEKAERAGTVVYCGTLLDETARDADWFLPVADDLESWGDYEPYPGINGLLQPTMQPLTGAPEIGDVLLMLASAAGKPLRRSPGGPVVASARDWLQARWSLTAPGWEEALRRGGSWPEGSARAAGVPRIRSQAVGAPGKVAFGAPENAPEVPLADNQAKLWLWPSIMLFDGRVANRGWLQEAPEPVSFTVWGSWIDIHPEKAERLGIRHQDFIELTAEGGGRIEAPARVTADVNRDTVALCLGQGHTALGETAAGVGVNGFVLLPPPDGAGNGMFGRVTLRRTGQKGAVVSAIATREQHRRDLLRWRTIEEVRQMKPGTFTMPLPEGYTPERDLYPPHRNKGHRWAMAIDLQRCIGCGACAVACYAENNIPVMGRQELARGREMAWLKVVPYRHPESPLRIGWIPLPCQHCDAAPCEPVCPVFASVHNDEGLNAQIYNRCIGTRYCSNNCPYKVRRFNWLNHRWREPLQWQLNPEVTVRSRGVMEKCTFCVQRIRNAEYRAKIENRALRDGEAQPACVQSCPTRVFTFGDLLDPGAEVSRIIRSDPRRYQLLQELNTKPAVAYLYRIEQP